MIGLRVGLAFLALMAPQAVLAAGDAAKGKALYVQCMACHKIDKTGASLVGPNLYRVVGRPVASMKAFKYSPAMSKKGGSWTEKELDSYLAAPMKAIPGNRMPYAGMKDPAARQNLIAYLIAASK